MCFHFCKFSWSSVQQLFVSWIKTFVLYLKSYYHSQGHMAFFHFMFYECYSLCFKFKSIIHFELTFVQGTKPVFRFIYLFMEVYFWALYLCSTIFHYVIYVLTNTTLFLLHAYMLSCSVNSGSWKTHGV